MDLQHFLSNIQDVDTALSFYHVAGAAIDPGNYTKFIIIIIIIKICRAHISTLLGAQSAETKKKHEYKQFTVIAKTKLRTKNYLIYHNSINYMKYTPQNKIRVKSIFVKNVNQVRT